MQMSDVFNENSLPKPNKWYIITTQITLDETPNQANTHIANHVVEMY